MEKGTSTLSLMPTMFARVSFNLLKSKTVLILSMLACCWQSITEDENSQQEVFGMTLNSCKCCQASVTMSKSPFSQWLFGGIFMFCMIKKNYFHMNFE